MQSDRPSRTLNLSNIGTWHWTPQPCYLPLKPEVFEHHYPDVVSKTRALTHIERAVGVPQSIFLAPDCKLSELRKTGERKDQISISPAVMIVGNPKSGRTMAACAVVLVLLIVVSAAFVAMRKKTPPLIGVPLHPSTFALTSA